MQSIKNQINDLYVYNERGLANAMPLFRFFLDYSIVICFLSSSFATFFSLGNTRLSIPLLNVALTSSSLSVSPT